MQEQFGGVGSPCIDYELAPFVKYSFAKHLIKGYVHLNKMNKEDAKKLVGDKISIKDGKELAKNDKDVLSYALEMLEDEGNQHAEALFHNLNTLNF